MRTRDKRKLPEQVLDLMSCLRGHVADENMKQFYQKSLQGFSLDRLEGSGISEMEIPDLKEAERMLDPELPLTELSGEQIHLLVRTLGRKPASEQELETEQELLRNARTMARVLAGYQEEISLTLSSAKTEDEGTNIQFIVSGPKDTGGAIDAMIRGVYGRAKTEVSPGAPKGKFRVYAKARKMGWDSKKIHQTEDQETHSWVTAVASSLPADHTYTVQVCLQPAKAQENALRPRLEKLAQVYDQLKFYGEISWNRSMTLGENRNQMKEHFIKEAMKLVNLEDVYTYGDSYAENFTLGSKEIKKEILLLLDELEYEMLRTKKMLYQGCCTVSISITAESEETLQAVTSILSGMMEQERIHLTWGVKPVSAMMGYPEELLPFLLFPTREYAGFAFVENEMFSLMPSKREGLEIGHVLWNDEPVSKFSLPRRALNRHTFIAGMTGAGKTNTMFNLIEGVGLPFLVIEPVKGEYRALRGRYPELKVWVMKTAGGVGTELLRVNPFWFPEHANLAFHIDSMKTILSSAFELSAAMPNILEQCLYRVYVKAGWDLITNENLYRGTLPEEYLYPDFDDLCNEIEDYLNRAEFGEEVMGNYKGALLTRMRSFVNGFKGVLLNTSLHPDYAAMMNGRNVIELEGLADDADKCLVMGTLLVQYYEFLKLHFQDTDKESPLKHLFVIEEAHRLFKNTTRRSSGEGPDPTGQLVESLGNIMAEIRAFGEGMLIVDQSPAKIAEDVIKNSATKIIHRLDHEKDIKMISSSLLLPKGGQGIPALKQGEALVRTEGMPRPCKVKMRLSQIKEAYQLSGSFQSEAEAEGELAAVFAATSILQNEDVFESIAVLTEQFWNTLLLSGPDQWETTVDQFFALVICKLQQWGAYDMVDSRFSVLQQIAAQVVKRRYGNLGKKHMGILYMFLMRLFDLYWEARNGGFVKKGSVTLLWKYLEAHIKVIITEELLRGTAERDYQDFCQLLEGKTEDRFMSVLYAWIKKWSGDEEDLARQMGAEELRKLFLWKMTISTDIGFLESRKAVFERLERELKSGYDGQRDEANE